MTSDVKGPVLLVGGGPGLATSGLLYLATYLRRHGVEAYSRPLDTAPKLEEMKRRLHLLLDRVRPSVVGVSLKWFLHIHRALEIAGAVKAHDPNIRVVFGGDTASFYHRELVEFSSVDAVIRGDGEAPLLAFARGLSHPNLSTRGGSRLPLVDVGDRYVQTKDQDDSTLAALDAIFLCESDRYFVPPFVVGGKGCSQGCLYCGGARTAQTANFARKKSFMRPVENVRADILELAKRAYCLVYDFSDHPLKDPTTSLAELWSGLGFSKSGILYYAWRVPPKPFIELLAKTFESVTLGLDFGCFSERQRAALVAAHLLKPLPDDAEYLDVVRECARYPNVRVRVSGVAGLPFVTPQDLAAEERLIDELLGCDWVEDVLFDRVHGQPGAPVLDDPAALGVTSPVRSFRDFLAWSAEHAPNGEYVPPLLQHASRAEPEGARGGVDPNLAIAASHRDVKGRIAAALAARAPQLEDVTFGGLANRRFRRAPRSRVLNRYAPRSWWLDFERPRELDGASDDALDEPMARIVTGHVWDEEFGAVSVPEVLADYVLPAFEEPRSTASALASIRARGAEIDEPALASIVHFFHQRGILRSAT